MTNIESIKNKETDEIGKELSSLKEEIGESSGIETTAKKYGIPSDVANEYTKILRNFYAPDKIPNDFMKEGLESQLGLELGEFRLTNKDGIILYYIKKLCPNKYKEISLLTAEMIANEWILVTPGRLNVKYGSISPNQKIESQNNPIKDIIQYIELYGDDTYDVLKFCSPSKDSYLKTSISKYSFKDKNGNNGGGDSQREESESRAMITQFFENFIYETESVNLLTFLRDYPQTLDNLGGKEIKSINLSINSGINFAFRGIIEMVKSRPDIKFPHLKEKPTEEEKSLWRQQWEKIIREYENMLRNYISEDFNQGNERDNKQPFDKIFYTTPVGDYVFDNAMILKKGWIQKFSGNELSDYSFNIKEDSEEQRYKTSKEMLSNIEKYVKEHPNEKILVCVEQHGNPDGSSGNGWSKEDWLRIANLSENIKIWSTRCYFGTAFDNNDIYKNKASISGFSNLSTASAYTSEAISMALNKGLGFHEMEIYTRLNYPISISPLTESMEYMNRNTGKNEIGKIGLAHNDDGQGDNLDNNYA